MILVRGPWDKTSGSPRLPFDTSHSFSQVCVEGRLGLTMCVHVYEFLCVIDCGLLVQGKTGGVGW